MSEFSSFIWLKQPLHWHNTDVIFAINQKNGLNNYPIGVYDCKKWSKTISHWHNTIKFWTK